MQNMKKSIFRIFRILNPGPKLADEQASRTVTAHAAAGVPVPVPGHCRRASVTVICTVCGPAGSVRVNLNATVTSRHL